MGADKHSSSCMYVLREYKEGFRLCTVSASANSPEKIKEKEVFL